MAEQPAGKRMTNEERAYLERAYQNQYAMVGNAINAALEELQALNSASVALENMDRVAGKESVATIGGDFYIKSKVNTDSKVIIGVGGGFMVEKGADAARESAKKRLDAKNEMISKLVKNRRELEQAIIDIQAGVTPK